MEMVPWEDGMRVFLMDKRYIEQRRIVTKLFDPNYLTILLNALKRSSEARKRWKNAVTHAC
jgi:hypothetical protein